MSITPEFYRALEELARANAVHTLAYCLEEAVELEQHLKARRARPLVIWPDECELIVSAITDATAGKMIMDPHGVVLWCNDAIGSWVNLPPNQMIGRCLWDVSRLPQNGERQRHIATALSTGRVQIAPVAHNSRFQPIQSYVVPLPMVEGPCVLTISKVLSKRRVFVQAFGAPQVIE